MTQKSVTTLASLFTKYGSDKAKNGYAELYECLFHSYRYKPIKFLEIGIGTMIPGMISSMYGYAPDTYKPGASLRAWRDYFHFGLVYGVDVQPDTQFSEPRITTIHADSRNQQQIYQIFDSIGIDGFDIILDDGSHHINDVLATIKVMINKLNPGGTYIIEDVAEDYAAAWISHMKNAVGDLPMFLHGLKGNVCVIANPIIGQRHIR